MLIINFNNYNNISLINYDNKINHRLTNHRYKLQTKTQINLLIKKHLRIHINHETIKKVLKTLIEIRLKNSLLRLKSIISKIKKIRL